MCILSLTGRGGIVGKQGERVMLENGRLGKDSCIIDLGKPVFKIFLTTLQVSSTLFQSYFLIISFGIILLSLNLALKRENQTWGKNLFLTFNCICYKNQSKYNSECGDIDAKKIIDCI